MSPFEAWDPLWAPFCISMRCRSRLIFCLWMSSCSGPTCWKGTLICWTAFTAASDIRTDSCGITVVSQFCPLTWVSAPHPSTLPRYCSCRSWEVANSDSFHLTLSQKNLATLRPEFFHINFRISLFMLKECCINPPATSLRKLASDWVNSTHEHDVSSFACLLWFVF